MIGSDFSGNLYTSVYKNLGNGNFSLYYNLSPPVNNGSIALGDLNNDGNLDLLLTGADNFSGYYFLIYTNSGNGSFVSNLSIEPGVYYSSIAVVDIDNDNDLDIVLTGMDNTGKTILKFYKN